MDVYYENLLLDQPESVELWSAYANSLRDPLDRAKVLARAAAAVPDLTIWQRLIELRMGREGEAAKEALYECLVDALALFPKNKQMWKTLLGEFPGPASFDHYLRYGPDPGSIWPEYLKWADENNQPEVYARYAEFIGNPVQVAEQLLAKDHPSTALGIILSAPMKSLDDFKVLVKAAESANDPRCTEFYRSALRIFPQSDGWIIPAFAAYLTSQGENEDARCLLESSLTVATSVRAFVEIFAAACSFYEAYISSLIDAGEKSEVALESYQLLLKRRRLLLNEVCIRTEPNFVGHWLERAELLDSREFKVKVFDEALEKIDPHRAEGGLSRIWVAYSQSLSSMVEVRTLFDRATKVPFREMSDLVSIWKSWAQREISDPKRSLRVLEKALAGPANSSIQLNNHHLSPQERLHKSPDLWKFYLELATKYSDLDKVREIYSKMLRYKVVSVSGVISYANLLASNGFVEESYRVYERATAEFPFPSAYKLWISYLDKVKETRLSLERLRDLYQQVLDTCPPDQALPFYLRYSQLELDKGLVSSALTILARGLDVLPPSDLPELLGVYLTALKDNNGLQSTRPIYEKALGRLQYDSLGSFAREFAEVELQLGDLNRVRSILKFASQFYDPQLPKGAVFWDRWQEIEQEYGDAASFREMLLVKRTVEDAILSDPYRLADREEYIDFVKT